MENVERTQFVVLTGHLDEHPLPELIRRLRVQRKSGRLRVEYAEGPGSFFFEDGQMVEAQLGELRGVEALYAALALPNASFNFNPLVRPPERNIDRQGQQFIRDLTEAPRREGLSEIRVAGGASSAQAAGTAALPPQRPLQLPPAAEELLAPIEHRLSAVEGAIDNASRRFSRERLVYAVVIGFLVGLSFITTVTILYDPLGTGRANPGAAAPARPAGQLAPSAAVNNQQPSSDAGRQGAAAQPGGVAQQPGAARQSGGVAQPDNSNGGGSSAGVGTTDGAAADSPPVPAAAAVIGSRRFDGVPAPRREYVVEVLVEVKAGRVADARVMNPRPGASAYEAVAVKMARERRYPEGFTGGERVRIKVKP